MKNILKHTIFLPALILFLTSITILTVLWRSKPNLVIDTSIKIVKKDIVFSPFKKNKSGKISTKYKFTESFLKTKTVQFDTTVYIKKISKKSSIPFEIDEKEGKIYKRIYTGTRINIAFIGVDSRIGAKYKHADANHVLSILPGKKIIEIISIPRDTYADAGMPDSTNFNKLTNVLGKRGRKKYLYELARIAEVDHIHYYVEFGFSQAMGILKWLGYQNYQNTLQILRSRKIFKGSDWQRTYNQGTFIKQMIIKNQDKLNGVMGGLIIDGLLAFVQTNLTKEKIVEITDSFKEKDFVINDSLFSLIIRPKFAIKFKSFDFTDTNVITQLNKQITSDNDSNTIRTSNFVTKKLQYAINKSIKDSLKRPNIVIRNLKTFYNQKAWHQIIDDKKMTKIRSEIKILLSNAYFKLKKNEIAQSVINNIENENKLFKKKASITVNYSNIVIDSLVGFNNMKEKIENYNPK